MRGGRAAKFDSGAFILKGRYGHTDVASEPRSGGKVCATRYICPEKSLIVGQSSYDRPDLKQSVVGVC